MIETTPIALQYSLTTLPLLLLTVDILLRGLYTQPLCADRCCFACSSRILGFSLDQQKPNQTKRSKQRKRILDSQTDRMLRDTIQNTICRALYAEAQGRRNCRIILGGSARSPQSADLAALNEAFPCVNIETYQIRLPLPSAYDEASANCFMQTDAKLTSSP